MHSVTATRYQGVEVQRRTADGWIVTAYGPGDEIELESIDIRFPLSALYRGTTVPEVESE